MVSSSVSMDRWRSVLVERSVRSQKIMSFFLSLVKQNSHSDTNFLSSHRNHSENVGNVAIRMAFQKYRG